MEIDERMDLIRRNTEEILTEDSLRALLESETPLRHYIGFEISGKIHLGTGLMCMQKVKDFMEAGADCTIFLADWHSWINDKLGGDPEVIKKVAVGYFKEGMKASMLCLGGDPERLNFVLGTDLYHNNDQYWQTVIDVSKNTTLSRISRSITILGRKEGGSVDFAKLIYPPMQVADIFVMGINMPHAGLDQRKAQVIARDVAEKVSFSQLKGRDGSILKPSAVHHHLILGLGKPPEWPIPKDRLQDVWSSLKMSKSKPDTCVFIHDEPDEIRRKVVKAFCPEGEVDFNPVLDWCRSLVFPLVETLSIDRPEKFGGPLSFSSYNELERAFLEKSLHPADLKTGVAEAIVSILAPAREHFAKPDVKKTLDEMENLLVTR